MAGTDIVGTVKGWIRGITSVGVAFLGLAIVAQILFGTDVAFVPVDVIGNISGLVASLGNSGLVGLITVGIIYWLFKQD